MGEGNGVVVVNALICAIIGCCGIEPSQTFLLKLHRCVKEKRKRNEGRQARMRDHVMHWLFSAERERGTLRFSYWFKIKRTTAASSTKRRRNLGGAALKRQTEKCLFCALIVCKCLMRASSCSFEFKSLMS